MNEPSHSRAGRPPRACGHVPGGFTLVELLTACVIVSVALLGVHAIFHNVIRTERHLTIAWQERQAAEAVVSQICEAVESAVEIRGLPTMKTGKENNVQSFLECMAHGGSGQPTLQRRRYRWNSDSGIIDLRTIAYCGSQPVSLQVPAEEDPWTNVKPVTIGQNLKSLTIQFKTAGSDWEDRYTRSGLPTIVRVKATVGGTTVERIVSCPVTAAALEGSE
jgi:prepilin-type N-terminal cleavage/methylation domain-containing protein